MKIKEKPEDFIVEEIPSRTWKEKGKYYVYKATKKELTTPQLITILAKQNNVQNKHIRYAGLKDKQAITTQYITTTQPLTNTDERITIELVGRIDEHLHLGELEGNKFTITIKETNQPTKTTIIPNYFGEQRFSKNNVELGLLIAHKQYEELAEKIGEEYEGVQKTLERTPEQPLQAIQKAPQRILLIYIHALQSKLWNEAVEKYLETNPAEQQAFPLIGAATTPEPYETYYEETLQKHDVTIQDFYNKQLPYLTQEGEQRKLLQTFIEEPNYEQLDKTTWKVTFALTPGSYATTTIHHLFQ